MSINWALVPLGEMSDEDIVKFLKTRDEPLTVSRPTVTRARQKLNIPRFNPSRTLIVNWEEVPLGVKPDTVLARELNFDPSTIARQRRVRGIEPVPPGRPSMAADWDKEPLGEVLDICIAQRLGVSHVTVLHQRRRRGIPRAPKTPRNELLSLVYRSSARSTAWYAERLERSCEEVLKELLDLVELGFVGFLPEWGWLPARPPEGSGTLVPIHPTT